MAFAAEVLAQSYPQYLGKTRSASSAIFGGPFISDSIIYFDGTLFR
jgi:hypothetical protein